MPSSNCQNKRLNVEDIPAVVRERYQSSWMPSRDTLEGYLFLAPFFVVYCVFLIYPIFQGIYISLFDWELVGDFREFIGFDNYSRMLSDDFFWSSLWHTVYFVLLSTPFIVVVGLLLGIALNQRIRGLSVFRTIFFAPLVLSVATVSLIWVMVLDPSLTRGLLTQFLSAFGIEPINWLSNRYTAMPAVVLTTLWWTTGFNMVLFLAGLQDIPSELYEAAKLDGAGLGALFRHITLPSLRRTILLVIILQIIASFQIFGQVFLMTKGGPANSTRVLVQYIYEVGFRDWKLGYASTISYVLFFIMFAISLLQLRLAREEG